MSSLLLFPKINRVYRESIEHFSHLVKKWNISVDEGNLLVYLSGYGPCSISQIGKVIGHKPSTLTSMLDRLEGKKLLKRISNPSDRRSLLIELDKEGSLIAAEIIELVEKLESEILEGINQRQIDGFLAILSAIGKATKISLKD